MAPCKTIILLALLSALISSSIVNSSEEDSATGGVMCVHCNSHPNQQGKACEDPIQMDKLPRKRCSSGMCLKYIQNVENDIKQIDRGCADELEPILVEREKEEGCVLSTGTKLIQVEICNCKGAECNGASDVKSTTLAVLAAALTSVIAKFLI